MDSIHLEVLLKILYWMNVLDLSEVAVSDMYNYFISHKRNLLRAYCIFRYNNGNYGSFVM